MLNYILTLIVPFIAIILGGAVNVKKKDDAQDLFSKDYTSVLKGICCIIVVMVHIRDGYTNPVQDAIGSFGYICVTLFFMISAYGMQLSFEKKNDYLHHFWRNRLLALLVPCFLINVFAFVLFGILDGAFAFRSLWYINDYVLVLLQYCVWFYLVMKLKRAFAISNKVSDMMLIIGVIMSSLIAFFFADRGTSNLLGWRCERFGLIYGLLLFRFNRSIKEWLIQNRLSKIILFTILSVIIGLLYLRWKNVFFWGEYLLKIILGATIIVWILLLSVKRQFGNKISFWLGRISYEVYLLHTAIMLAIIKVVPDLSSGVFILATYLLTLVFATGINWCSATIVKKLRV